MGMYGRWIIGVLAVLLLAACGSVAGNIVARYENVTLTREELDQRIARVEKGQEAQVAQGMQPRSRTEIEQDLVSQFLDQQLLLAQARQRSITIAETEIDERISLFRVNVQQATGQPLDQVVQDQLGLPGEASSEFRQFVAFILAQNRLAETLVTTDTVRAQVEQQVNLEAQQMVQKADVQHILVDTEDEAKQVLTRLNNGETFENLAKELSKDPGSAENGGLYQGITPGQFVPEFDKAMFQDLQPGQTTAAPVQTQFGWHIIRLVARTEGPALSPDQVQQEIEFRLQQELQVARQDALRTLIDEERAKAIRENRLVEPTYPTPEPFALPTVTPAP